MTFYLSLHTFPVMIPQNKSKIDNVKLLNFRILVPNIYFES